jgi:2-hydroxy-6-oxonona-2,4-dienedioate hydrolase
MFKRMKWIVRATVAVAALVGVFVGVKYAQYRSAMDRVRAALPGESRIVRTAAGEVEVLVQGSSDDHVLLIHGTPGSYRTVIAGELVEAGCTVFSPSRPVYFRTPLASGATVPARDALYAALRDALECRTSSGSPASPRRP